MLLSQNMTSFCLVWPLRKRTEAQCINQPSMCQFLDNCRFLFCEVPWTVAPDMAAKLRTVCVAASHYKPLQAISVRALLEPLGPSFPTIEAAETQPESSPWRAQTLVTLVQAPTLRRVRPEPSLDIIEAKSPTRLHAEKDVSWPFYRSSASSRLSEAGSLESVSCRCPMLSIAHDSFSDRKLSPVVGLQNVWFDSAKTKEDG